MGSNALAFKEWAVRERLVYIHPVASFSAKVIGIDAEDYLRSLLITGNREPLLPALGGRPFCLWNRLDEDLEGYKANNIKPIFVFNGLDLACRSQASILDDSQKNSETLSKAWQIYDQGKGEEAVITFGKACTYRMYPVLRSLQMRLHSKGVQLQIAPFSAAAQLTYLQREGYINGMQGSASCLLFGGDRVILSCDWINRKVTWLALDSCLQKLRVNKFHFGNICLLSGSSILPAVPDVELEAAKHSIMAVTAALKAVAWDVDGFTRSKPGNYHDHYHRSLFALRSPAVLTVGGDVVPLNWRNDPGDVHEWTGQRLPDELYFYLSRGLVGPRLLNWRTRQQVLEIPPLDGGESTAYKELISSKMPLLRAQAIALLTTTLHRYYHKQEVQLQCWYNNPSSKPIGFLDVAEQAKAPHNWHVKGDILDQILPSEGSWSLSLALSPLADEAMAKKTIVKGPIQGDVLNDEKSIRANVVWRFLTTRGYITADHTLSPRGKAFLTALDHARNSQGNATRATASEFEDAILMAFEMVRIGLLDKTPMFPVPPYSGGPIRGSDDDKANILLISRVACLGFLRHRAIGYTGPLSRNLLAYHQCLSVVRGALRDLVEAHACHMLLSGSADRNLDNNIFTDVAAGLPLVEEPDLGLSVLVKCYLDELCQPVERRVAVAGWFPHARDIPGDLQKTWKLWDAVVAGVQAADNSIVRADIKKSFKAADDWLQEKLAPANAPDGSSGDDTNAL